VIAGLLLAAGGASRFGSQKLIAPVDGEPLVRRAARVLSPATESLVVVVGSHAAAVRDALAGLDALVVLNDDWASGLASSVRAGIAALDRRATAVLIALGDQPALEQGVVDAVVREWRSTGCAIIAPRYRGVQGHPVLFARSVFDELWALAGDRGAKAVIERDPARVAYLDIDAPMPRDVDTVHDLGTVK
jgi:molybdenum cofactor cytidylyltransferase